MSPLVIFACIAYYGLAYSTNDYMIHSIWKPLRSLPNSMAYIIGGVHNDEIRILGGYTTTFLEIDSTLQSYEYRSSIQYTPSGSTKFALSPWYTTNILSNMSLGLIMGSDTQQYITINNFIYIIGTNDRSQFRDGPVDGKLFIYDMESQSFLSTTTYNSTMIIPRAGNCIATNNVHLFSMGGYDDTGTNTVTYIKYHIKDDQWSIGPDLNEPRYSAQCVWAELNNHLYVFGGYANSVEWLDISKDESGWEINWNTPWSSIGGRYKDNSQTLYLLTPAQRGGHIFNISNNQWVAEIIQYDLYEQAFGFASVLYQPEEKYECVIVIGGFTDTVQYNCIEILIPTTQSPTNGPTTRSPSPATTMSIFDPEITQSEISPHNNVNSAPDTNDSFPVTPVIIVVITLAMVIILAIVLFVYFMKKNRKQLILQNPLVILIGIGEYDQEFRGRGDSKINGRLPPLPVHIDLDNLTALFARDNFNYTVLQEFAEEDNYKLNWTQDELKQYLISKSHYLSRNMKTFNGLIVVISCHAIEGHICTSDYKLIEMAAIHRIFSLNHIEVREFLRLFIYDCCNGNNEYGKGIDDAVDFDIVDKKAKYTELKQEEYDDDDLEEEKEMDLIRPFSVDDIEAKQKSIWPRGKLNPDYLLAKVFAANQGFQSLMHKDKGSYMIQKFVDKLKEDLERNRWRYIEQIFYDTQEELKARMQIEITFNNRTRYIKLQRHS